MVYNYENWDILWNCYICNLHGVLWGKLGRAKKTKKGFHLVHQTTQPNLGLCTIFFNHFFPIWLPNLPPSWNSSQFLQVFTSISTQPHSMAKTHSFQNSKHP
jgi:hypothetical protein